MFEIVKKKCCEQIDLNIELKKVKYTRYRWFGIKMFSPLENIKSDLYLHVCKQKQILQSSFERLV